MIKITKTVQVQASPENVWGFLGDLGRAPDYIPGIVSASIEGLQRFCTDQDGNEIHEQISEYSDKGRSFSFEHLRSPLPVSSSRGRFEVNGKGFHSSITMTWDLEFHDPSMATQMEPMLIQASKMTLDNIKKNVELR